MTRNIACFLLYAVVLHSSTITVFITMMFTDQIINFFYQIFQSLVALIFSPPPSPGSKINHNAPRIAVVGAGLTGVSSAAHAMGHGFEATIFKSGSRQHLSGIWSRVNNTSSLQIYSIMYCFHLSVMFRAKYPTRSIGQRRPPLFEIPP